MAAVYILYSNSLDTFYVGSCNVLSIRLEQHRSKFFPNAFTSKSDDWQIYFAYENLGKNEARKIEAHIKKMKSRKYFENLLKYPEIMDRLIERYSDAGSSR